MIHTQDRDTIVVVTVMIAAGGEEVKVKVVVVVVVGEVTVHKDRLTLAGLVEEAMVEEVVLPPVLHSDNGNDFWSKLNFSTT